ncbi:hypothetical protein OKA04_20540 [Luteolibacter flavescens]|uniref:Uncharacterized protein n=1 Tax=Luteolibacter flavescens TaxID=1859460 RepID=A0ABT3FU78_9BACT|nr:hypothetical protein [Luteolibacter flavescens]MCW1887139.1 hypothetical protein [Luteolibacter flavescens]
MHLRRHAILAVSLSLLALVSARAEESAASFPGLKSVAVPEDLSPFPGKLSYDPAVTQVLDKELAVEEGEPDARRLVSTKINREEGTTYFIDFDSGPSADPAFVITDEKSGKVLGSIGGESLIVPGNGFLYVSGRANRLHQEQAKYAIRGGKLVEIEQPFSYVGMKTKAKVALKLLAKKDGGETIANVPAGESLEVVLRDGEHLLIKTNFGLLGWWKANTNVMADNAEIEGIYFAGD